MTKPLSIMDTARLIGEKLDVSDPIPKIEPAECHVAYPSRKDMWPPEVWAEMQRIRLGERDPEYEAWLAEREPQEAK